MFCAEAPPNLKRPARCRTAQSGKGGLHEAVCYAQEAGRLLPRHILAVPFFASLRGLVPRDPASPHAARLRPVVLFTCRSFLPCSPPRALSDTRMSTSPRVPSSRKPSRSPSHSTAHSPAGSPPRAQSQRALHTPANSVFGLGMGTGYKGGLNSNWQVSLAPFFPSVDRVVRLVPFSFTHSAAPASGMGSREPVFNAQPIHILVRKRDGLVAQRRVPFHSRRLLEHASVVGRHLGNGFPKQGSRHRPKQKRVRTSRTYSHQFLSFETMNE